MAFNSLPFFTFFAALFVLYHAFSHRQNWRNTLLLGFNLTFFALLSGYTTILLMICTLADFSIAKRISACKQDGPRFRWLVVSVLINVLLILTFKHFTDWFELNHMDSPIHFPWPLKFIGVSFIAFRSMGYVFDVYYENIDRAEGNFISYASYISFFPLLLSGPISQAEDFLKTANSTKIIVNYEMVGRASFLIALGILKKFVFGNYLSINFIDRVFDASHLFTGLENFLAAVLQTLALYLDFSGYTDLVIGLSLLLGFDIIENFNFPFLSQNITEYWKRWHISLSTWFNQYVYFPLSYYWRSWGKFGTCLAVFCVFSLSGFWHGTSPNFWLWGLMHAVALIWDVLSSNWRIQWKKTIPSWLYKPLSIALTFTFLTFSGLFFKASDIHAGLTMIQKIVHELDFSFLSEWLKHYPWVAVIGLFILLIQFTLSSKYESLLNFYQRLHWSIWVIWVSLVIIVAFQFNAMGSLPFYYLQF